MKKMHKHGTTVKPGYVFKGPLCGQNGNSPTVNSWADVTCKKCLRYHR